MLRFQLNLTHSFILRIGTSGEFFQYYHFMQKYGSFSILMLWKCFSTFLLRFKSSLQCLCGNETLYSCSIAIWMLRVEFFSFTFFFVEIWRFSKLYVPEIFRRVYLFISPGFNVSYNALISDLESALDPCHKKKNFVSGYSTTKVLEICIH